MKGCSGASRFRLKQNSRKQDTRTLSEQPFSALAIHGMKPCFILVSGSILLPSSNQGTNLRSAML